MKILVVDDELVSRKKMKLIMDGLGECEAVASGMDAVAAYQGAWENEAPFDLVALDVLMPEMTGTQVLEEIRHLESEKNIPGEKRVKIFMVTSHADKDTIIACVQAGCDDFIAKPFDREIVYRKLSQRGFEEHINKARDARGNDAPTDGRSSGTKEGILQDIIERFNRGEIDLPSLPAIYEKYMTLVKNGANLQGIADLLRQDAAISSKLIGISNSSYYRGLVENKTLDQAIGRLGLDTTRQTVDAIANRSLYDGVNKKYSTLIEALWEHALSCAYAAQLVAETLRLKFGDDAFTLGLFHDIGKLLLVKVVGEVEKKGDLGEEVDGLALFETLDTYHGKTGSALLKKWGFSSGFVSVALYHDDPEKAKKISKELLVIHCANLLVKTLGYGQDKPLEIDLAGTGAAHELGLDGEMIDRIKQKVNEKMSELKRYLQ